MSKSIPMSKSISSSVAGWAATCWLCVAFGASPRQVAGLRPGPHQRDPSFGLDAVRRAGPAADGREASQGVPQGGPPPSGKGSAGRAPALTTCSSGWR